MTARVALSAGLVGLAAQSAPEAAAQPRVPVSPIVAPEAAVRKFKGRYVLKRGPSSFFMHLAGHASHGSHVSHASHVSHYSGSDSSPAPIPREVPETPPPAPERTPPPAPKPRPLPRPAAEPLLREGFDAGDRLVERWRIGVLATPPETFDASLPAEQTGGTLSITPAGQRPGAHFSGYVSVAAFDLTTSTIAVALRRAAVNATTIFAAAIDADNWVGFRIEGGQLLVESHAGGRVSARKFAYGALQNRFLRLRMSDVASVVVWETSSDGLNWTPEYVESARIDLTSVHIALSAGTGKAAALTGPATFESVTVERKP